MSFKTLAIHVGMLWLVADGGGICPHAAAQTIATSENPQPSSSPASEAAPPADPASPNQVLAKLGGRPILRRHVQHQFAGPVDGPPLSWTAEQAAVQLLAQQQQALQTLRKLQLAAAADEVDAWLAAQAKPDSAPASEPASEVEAYREFIAFRLSWQRYLAQHLTQANLVRHFENQTARFDGTRFQVDLLSIAVPAGESEARRAAAQQLADLRTAALSQPKQPLTPPEQTEQVIVAAQGLWVRGSEALDPRLVSPLLSMAVEDISPVVHTASGVHILRLRAVEPGDLELSQVQIDVRSHMLLYLLDHLADQSAAQLPLLAQPRP